MATTISKPVTRKTCHTIGGKAIVATFTPGGISLRLERSSKSVTVDYIDLYQRLVIEERRGGQSDISIKPRAGRRS
jgi:hypothetical protein